MNFKPANLRPERTVIVALRTPYLLSSGAFCRLYLSNIENVPIVHHITARGKEFPSTNMRRDKAHAAPDCPLANEQSGQQCEPVPPRFAGSRARRMCPTVRSEAHSLLQQGLLRVQAILGLVNDSTLFAVNYAVRNFKIAPCGQAV